MNEHSYIRSLHRKLPADFYRWKINDSYAGGVADAFYSGNSGQLFVEYKYRPKLPKRESTLIVPDCSALQEIWLKDRYIEGVSVAVILGTPLGGIVFTRLAWEDGIRNADIENFALTNNQIVDVILDHCRRGKVHVNNNEACYHRTG